MFTFFFSRSARSSHRSSLACIRPKILFMNRLSTHLFGHCCRQLQSYKRQKHIILLGVKSNFDTLVWPGANHRVAICTSVPGSVVKVIAMGVCIFSWL